jgi:enoyl-CoA hydratase
MRYLEGTIGYTIRRAQMAVFQDIYREFQTVGIRITLTQFSVMAVAADNPEVTQAELAEVLAVERPRIVPILNQLERMGLARRLVCDIDRRNRRIVLTAEGKHFSVGLDLKAMAGSLVSPDGGGGTSSQASRNISLNRNIKSMQASISALAECRVPVIAAVHGWCIGGGVDLIAACDIRVASDDAKFSVREAKVAIVADIGSLQRLPKIIGAGHVAELALTGKDIDADRAATIGLVNHVAAGGAEGVAALARQIADEIAVNSPLAVEGTKAVLAANDGRTVAEGLDYVADFNTLYINSNDLIEAMTSFMEKRPGSYTGT